MGIDGKKTDVVPTDLCLMSWVVQVQVPLYFNGCSESSEKPAPRDRIRRVPGVADTESCRTSSRVEELLYGAWSENHG